MGQLSSTYDHQTNRDVAPIPNQVWFPLLRLGFIRMLPALKVRMLPRLKVILNGSDNGLPLSGPPLPFGVGIRGTAKLSVPVHLV